MHPIAFHVGEFSVATYGVFFGAGIFLGTALATRQAKCDGVNPAFVWDIGILVVVATLLGSRAEFVRTHWDQFRDDLPAILHYREGGMVFYGGFIAGVLAIAAYGWVRKVPALALLDVVAPWVMFGDGIGRIGCFAAGCCYGKPTAMPWGVVFPEEAIAPAGIALHPTQLYESAYAFAIAAVLALFPRSFVGQRFSLLLGLYGACRFVNEMFRGDPRRGQAIEGWLTNGQLTSIGMVLAGVVVWWVGARWYRLGGPDGGSTASAPA